MDRITGFFSQHYDRTMSWYNHLTFLEQMGVLFGLFIVAFFFVAFILIRK